MHCMSLLLFYRDTLFSFHKASEDFLQTIMSLYVSSHYKVSAGFMLDNLSVRNGIAKFASSPS